jgi:uncharacterized membrane protein YkoI
MDRRHYVSNLNRLLIAALAIFGVLASQHGVEAQHHEKDEGVLIGRLKDSKHSLVDGIRQAQRANGPAISAKFEMKGDTLMLSVYTAKEGLGKDAEHNVLMELIGDASKTEWQPEVEVFEDKPHIARSAMHLTVLQLTKLPLEDVVKRASAQQRGTVYSVIPAVRDGRYIFDVLVATPDGKSSHLEFDPGTGKVTK